MITKISRSSKPVSSTGVLSSSFRLSRQTPVVQALSSQARTQDVPQDLAQSPTPSLVRSLAVYSALSFPSFVDIAPKLLSVTTSIPIVRQVALSVVRNTFFDHFVAGETFNEAIPVIRALNQQNIAVMVDHSVEVDEVAANETDSNADAQKHYVCPNYQENLNEIMETVVLAAGGTDAESSTARKPLIAIKLTALLPSADSLQRFSKALVDVQSQPDHPFTTDLLDTKSLPSLSERDIKDLKALRDSLFKIADLAVKHQIRVVLDAEHTWYQPAIDAFATSMMLRANTASGDSPIKPVIYTTYQAYRRSTMARLRHALAHAASHGYVPGIKLVRGAYHTQEVAAHERRPSSRGLPPPVWSEKLETDRCYNDCANLLLDQLRTDGAPRIGLLFGTHNKESCNIIMDGLLKRGIVTEATNSDGHKVFCAPRWLSDQLQLGQLYGMADELTNYITCRLICPGGPMVLKCLPYGTLEEVIPYLGRRAIENRSVLGNSNADLERNRVVQELRRRLLQG